MANFRNMVDMTLSPEEKIEKRMEDSYPPPISLMPDIPSGLCMCWDEDILEKLNIEVDDCDVGDMLHVSGMVRLTSKSINETDSGRRMRFEVGFVFMSVEDENEEAEETIDANAHHRSGSS